MRRRKNNILNKKGVVMKSEVARIRAQIDAELHALSLLMNAPAIVASHQIVSHRYACLDTLGRKLSDVVGEQEADKMMVEMYTERMR